MFQLIHLDDETRYALISRFKTKCYVAIFTMRENVFRTISVRRCRKNEETNYETITTKAFDDKFDNNEDISEHLDFSKSMKLKDFSQLKTDTRKVNVDFPEWVIQALDQEAKKIGVTRQSIIKVWIAERLKSEADHLHAS